MPTEINQPLNDQPALFFSGRTVHLSEFELPPRKRSWVDERDIIRSAYISRPGLSPTDIFGRALAGSNCFNSRKLCPKADSLIPFGT